MSTLMRLAAPAVALALITFAAQAQTFAELDTDGNGTLSKEEVEGANVDIFDDDTNKDGVLDEEEFKAGMAPSAD